MDSADKFTITPKGVEEVQHRNNRLSIKRRSVLLLLEKPQSIAQILQRTVFPHNEIVAEVEFLMREGFIRQGASAAIEAAAPISPRPSSTMTGASTDPIATVLRLDEEIIISEAKFLLADFAMDHFGVQQARELSEEVRACRELPDIQSFLQKIYAMTEKAYPDKIPVLLALVKEINDTA